MSVTLYHASQDGPARYVDTIESDSPVICAAFKVAQKVHKDQPRSETTGAPYIVHPIMAYHMLLDFGIENPLTLAGMLLHDALEDCKEYWNKPEKMCFDLCNALEEEGVKDAEEIGHLLVEELCLPLTNPTKMMEGKRSHQVHHADSMASRVAMMKIVDQASSVLDSILVEDAGLSVEQKRNWNYKALDVVKAAVSDRERLYYWGNLFKVLFTYNMEMLEAQEAGDKDKVRQMRQDFDYDKAKSQAAAMPNKQMEADCAAKHVERPGYESLDKGCLNVQLNSEGQVCGYHILVNQLADRSDERNKCAIDLMGHIEEHSRMTRVTTGTPEVESGRLVRVKTIKPAIDAQEFCAIAKQSGAIDRAFETQIKRAQAELIVTQIS